MTTDDEFRRLLRKELDGMTYSEWHQSPLASSTPTTRVVPIVEPDEHAGAVIEELIGELICGWDQWGYSADEKKTPADWYHRFLHYMREMDRQDPRDEIVRALAVISVAFLVVSERRKHGVAQAPRSEPVYFNPLSPPPPAFWRPDDFED